MAAQSLSHYTRFTSCNIIWWAVKITSKYIKNECPKGMSQTMNTNILQHSKAKTPHSHFNRHKNKHAPYRGVGHIHTSNVSKHLATRGNIKIMRTPPSHISCSEDILLRHTRRTLAPLKTNKPPFLKSYLHKVDAKSHPSPLCPLCNTHTQHTSSQLHPHMHHVVTPGFVDRSLRSDGTAGQMDGGEAG